MHIVNVMKKIDVPLVTLRTMYSFQKVSRERQTTIIAPSHSDKIENTTWLTDKLRLHTIPFGGLPLIREIRYSLRLISYLQTLGFDIVNLNSHLQISALPVLIAAKTLRVPLVVTVHGVYSKSNLLMDTIQKLYLHTFCRILWRRSQAVVCLTEEDAREVQAYGCPTGKIKIIPNWVNTELFMPKDKRKEGNILWAGRFASPKGLEYLVRAARIVVNKHPNCKFILIGDGPLKAKIKKMICDENLAEHFDVKHQMPNDRVAEEMADASIFIFPSLKEGMPYAILEAAASGMAIVASDIPGIASVLKNGDHALLVRPRDPSALADAILKLLQDGNLRTKLQIEARKLIEDSYRVDIIVNKTLELYEGIVRKAPSQFAAD